LYIVGITGRGKIDYCGYWGLQAGGKIVDCGDCREGIVN